MSTAKLLIVNDVPAQMKALCASCETAGYTASCVTSAVAALAALRRKTFDLVLTDLNMPEMDGIALLRAAREIDPDLAGIIMTGEDTIDLAGQALEAGALDCIAKPLKLGTVLPVLARALAVRRLRLENIHLQQAVAIYELSSVIQSTFGFDAVLHKVADAAMAHTEVGGVCMLVPIEDGHALRVAVSRGDNASQNEGKYIPFNRAISRWVERSLKRVARLNELIVAEVALPLVLFQLPESANLAMLAGGSFVGILNFTPKNAMRPISREQIKAMNILAGAAASALQAAALLDQLRSAEERYHSLSERAADIIIRYELFPQPHVAYVNAAFASILGYSPNEYYADPELILNIVHPDDRVLKEAVLRGDVLNGSTVTLRCCSRAGNTVWLEQHNTRVEDPDGRLIAIEGIARDITERKNLEEQLRQSQKMEAIGVLAGGLAHDFNNMLTVIIGYSDLILADDAPAPPIVEKVDQVRKAAELAAALTRQLLAFGRKQVVRRRLLDLNAIVNANSRMLRRGIGDDIELAISLDEGVDLVNADPGQIAQILMNLTLNAKGSMPLGGKLTIETKNVTLEESPVAGNTPCNRYVMIAVTDTGCGMNAATQARIFEPFFTTKELGQGTGLGLSIVYGIVKQNGGDIRVFSQPGKGSRFEVVLPRGERNKETDGVEVIPDPPEVSPRSRATVQTVLIVEDEPVLRHLIGTVLHNGGYDVRIARDAREALRICEQHEGRIGLVLTDIILPGMSGPAMVASLLQLDHSLKILYMSGYAGDAMTGGRGPDPRASYIQKPFTPVALIGKIRDILDNSAAPALPDPIACI